MPKRKRAVNSRQKRENDKKRKRQERQKAATGDVPVDQTVTDSSVPFGTEEEAMSASPGNFPGLGFMGFPPKEEKPLARVQASPRVKMHSPAPRLPSPRGSLFVREQDKAPSPDSLERVCAPPRASGPDTVHVSGPAGQAQLETSMYGGTSRKTKDEGYLTVNKKETERKSNRNENENNEKHMYENEKQRNENENNEKHIFSEKYNDENTEKMNADLCWQKSSKEGKFKISVQGSFHQADPIFEDNAGTQCVANCLSALAYHKYKNAINWTTSDIDRVLMTGDELYTYLQRSSSINDRYLLVEELPQLFECYNRSYTFRANESLASVILADDSLNYAEFNALPLDEAFQVALADNDGCFVCFGGNTFLIGKTERGFFAFDSHSRSSDGMLSMFGKSTRVLFRDVYEVYSHIQNLALSMGYSKSIECNLTGVSSTMTCIQNDRTLHKEKRDAGVLFEKSLLSEERTVKRCDQNDDLIFISREQFQFRFCPLNSEKKKDLCQFLNVPYICFENSADMQHSTTNMTTPRLEKKILGDGNCFFRAVSFSLTNSEDFHNVIRNAVCEHMIEYQELFQPFVNEQSVDSHISSTQMYQEGKWATDVEIFATAHLLHTDIYTFSRGCWLRFSVDDVEPSEQNGTEAIYLNHRNQNHYNVVLSVNGDHTDMTQIANRTIANEYEKRCRKRTRMQEIRQTSSGILDEWCNAEKRRRSLRKRYNDDQQFREKKLKAASNRYLSDEEFHANVKNLSKQRYYNDVEYNAKTKERSRRESKIKYATNPDHRHKVKERIIVKYSTNQDLKKAFKQRSIEKYKFDEEHRERMKKKNTERYASDEQHRDDIKKRSIQKYELNAEHREHVKARSKLKYKLDEEHRIQVNSASTKRYREDKTYKEAKLNAAATKYKSDGSFRLKRKASSKNQYDSCPAKKARIKERITNLKTVQRAKLENQDEIVKSFKEKAMQGIDYTCCCCDRLLFKNQVQKCERHTYAKNEQAANVADFCIQDKYCHQCSETCPKKLC